MKSLFTLCLLFLFFFHSHAQIEKGSVSLSGQVGFGQQWAGSEGSNGFIFDFSPAASFMVSDRLLIGGGIGSTIFSNSDNTNTANFIQPELRYYLTPQAEKNKFFLGAVGGIQVDEISNSTYSLNAGVNRFLNSNIALEGTASYQFLNAQDDLFRLGLNLRSFMSRDDRDNWKTASRSFQKGDLLVESRLAEVDFISDVIQLRMAPSAAYFLNEQVAIGGSISASTTIGTGDFGFKSSNLGVSTYARVYSKKESRWRWFGELGVAYDVRESSFEELFESKFRNFSTRAKVGANIFLTPNLALEPFVEAMYFFNSNAEYTNERPGLPPFVPTDFSGRLNDNRFQLSTGIKMRYFIRFK